MDSIMIKLGKFCLCSCVMFLVACGNKQKDYDATGTFEATETTVYAQQNGQLLSFDVVEGEQLKEGQNVGLIDTTQLQLQIDQMDANKNVFVAQEPDMQKQIAATRQQLIKAQQECKRYSELVKDGAAPRKILDCYSSQVAVLQKQLEAQCSSLTITQKTLKAQQSTSTTQIEQLRNRIGQCHIMSPVDGTVLEKYTECGEYVVAGKPLFKVANLRNVFLRAYVTSEQLAQVKVGQKVKVITDYGPDKGKSYDGIITWISQKSEFTPKTILT